MSLIGTSKADFASKLQLVPDSAIETVCRTIRIEKGNLVEFAGALDEIRYRQLLVMLSPSKSSEMKCKIPDCRLVYQETICSMEITGSMREELTLDIPMTCERERILVSCSSLTGHSFPNSFIMQVNGIVAIANSPQLGVLDISELLGDSATVHITFECENEEVLYNLSISKYQQLEKKVLLKQVLTRRLPGWDSPIPALCPITGEFMSIPVRSVKCIHKECFDIASLLKITPLGSPLECPVCGRRMMFSDLAVNYERMMENMRIRMKSAVPGMKEAGIRLHQQPDEVRSNFVDVGTQQVPDPTSIDVGTMTWNNEWFDDEW